MTTEKEQLEAEIAKRDARIAELERQGAALAASYCDGVIGDSYGHAYCKYKAELATLKAQQPSAGVVVGALVSALEGIVHDERVPNEVSQDYAALLIEARRLNPCCAQSVSDEREAFRDHLGKCAAEVATWPKWKRECLGRPISSCSRGLFETWAMETKHPVFCFIGDDWLDLGDDPNIYANDYIQGAWVMWNHLRTAPSAKKESE